ncbi:hypothetical protein Pth03_45020 [Planotetraspora thailandica]|uniref:Uncharacterized protein n=1 Tax=Planotetraspora thailandica TaxID=487172 RepID=A0A8J3V284_9ACTN|nr:hypothetical protein [Planotetraspora thailandica]GII56113.1 hypothetical protein Pth03_45020 [Planotetraspora thailandica]
MNSKTKTSPLAVGLALASLWAVVATVIALHNYEELQKANAMYYSTTTPVWAVTEQPGLTIAEKNDYLLKWCTSGAWNGTVQGCLNAHTVTDDGRVVHK